MRSQIVRDEVERFVACPRCAELASVGSRICSTCFLSLEGRTPLTDSQLAHYSEQVRIRQVRAKRRQRMKAASVAVIATAAVLVSYWLLGGFSEEPAPRAPISTLRSAEVGPETWPVVGGTLGGTRSTAASPIMDGTAAWRYAPDIPARGPMIADRSNLYVRLGDSHLAAVSAANGRELWRVKLDGVFDAAPAVAGGRLFAGMRDGRVVALDARDGSLVWQWSGESPVETSPIVVGGVVYVVSNTRLEAFDAENGSSLWARTHDDRLAVTAPAIDGNRLVVPTFSRILFFDIVTGERTFYLSNIFFSGDNSVAISGDRVFASSRGRLLVFDREIRRPWWDFVRGAWTWANVVGIAPAVPWHATLWGAATPGSSFAVTVSAERVFIANSTGSVRAFDVESGERLWERSGAQLRSGPIVVGTGLLLVERHSLVLLDAVSGVETGSLPFPDVTLDEVLVTEAATYVLTDAGALLAIREPPPAPP